MGVEDEELPTAQVVQLAGAEVPATSNSVEQGTSTDLESFGAIFHENATDEQRKTGSKFAFGCMFINCAHESSHENRWVPPKYIRCAVLMGGVDLDFSNAEFVHKDTYITCVGLMGGVSLTLPPGVRVVNSGVGICGAFESPERSTASGSTLRGPVIHIKGVALMSGVSCKYSDKVPAIRIVHSP